MSEQKEGTKLSCGPKYPCRLRHPGLSGNVPRLSLFFFAEKNSGAGLMTNQVPREIPALAHSFPPWVGWADMMIFPYLLQFENVLVEVILELLVGVVDAELFKTVPLEVFKPEDVEDPNGQALGETERMVITGGPSFRSNLSAGEGLRTRNIKQGAPWFFDFWFLFCFGATLHVM